ncbi:TniQ family protein [Aliirhizobium cellulosilyticum]|uniref:TniQ domain-containing protein n=1 Tax=Aliirhizobium cellulosilyticum TaxID=393664 RepID=A0A7W6S948_9HYPH|nr:TniQ family protein [Rhizobium cellulosilyticum]MBB4349494.1 hypothetical protein [Rhizobium cellulosilyticum]MBB4412284.1 hypothetical protein [Rhizobium cellulosilyticum]MBB4446915.1 hypothetical protein [Rhizobium cellulosilyticum]
MRHFSPDRLPKRPEIFPDEAFVSYLSRLAWENGFENVGQFCSLLRIPLVNTLHLRPADIERVGMMTEIPSSVLNRFAVKPTTIGALGHDDVKRSQVQTTGLRYCSACLADDAKQGTPRIRGVWQWRMIAHCTEHGCLLQTDKGGYMQLSNFMAFSGDPTSHEPKPMDADRYFTDRLLRPRDNAFLDQYPAYIAAELCTLIGHFEEGLKTGKPNFRIPDGYENFDLRNDGYKVAQHGVDAIHELMTAYVNKCQKAVRTAAGLYAPVLRWAKKNSGNEAYHPLFRLMQDHAEESIPFEPGAVFIWPVKAKKIYTLAAAASAYNLPEERVTRTLEWKFGVGNVPRFLKYADIHDALLDTNSSVSTSEAAAMLGCGSKVCDDLIREGILEVKANRNYNGRVYRLVHKDDIAALITKISDFIDPDLPPLGLVGLDAMKQYRIRVVQVLKFAFEGKLSRISVKHAEQPKLDTLLFDPTEIASVRPAPTQAPRDEREIMTIMAAGRVLGVKKFTLAKLIESGIIPVVPMNSESGKPGVRKADLDGFRQDYTYARDLADHRKITVAEVASALAAKAVSPVLKTRFDTHRLYKNSDLVEAGYH